MVHYHKACALMKVPGSSTTAFCRARRKQSAGAKHGLKTMSSGTGVRYSAAQAIACTAIAYY